MNNYSYFHSRLIDWVINTLNHQQDNGPLENLWDWLEKSKRPDTICISIGATRYTEFGATTFLEAGDQSIVLLFDSREHNIQELEKHIDNNTLDGLYNISLHPEFLLQNDVIYRSFIEDFYLCSGMTSNQLFYLFVTVLRSHYISSSLRQLCSLPI